MDIMDKNLFKKELDLVEDSLLNQCVCQGAVKNTFKNLIKKEYSSAHALNAAMIVLKHHHPEIPNHKIGKFVVKILNPEIKI